MNFFLSVLLNEMIKRLKMIIKYASNLENFISAVSSKLYNPDILI